MKGRGGDTSHLGSQIAGDESERHSATTLARALLEWEGPPRDDMGLGFRFIYSSQTV